MLAVNASGRVGKYFKSIHIIINISPAHSRGKPSSFASGQKNQKPAAASGASEATAGARLMHAAPANAD